MDQSCRVICRSARYPTAGQDQDEGYTLNKQDQFVPEKPLVPPSRPSIVVRALVSHQGSRKRHADRLKVAFELCLCGREQNDRASDAGGERPGRGANEVETLAELEEILDAAVERLTSNGPRPDKTTMLAQGSVLRALALLDAREHHASRLLDALGSKSDERHQLVLHALAADAHVLEIGEPAVDPRRNIALLRSENLAVHDINSSRSCVDISTGRRAGGGGRGAGN